jgi:hypothetical protein
VTGTVEVWLGTTKLLSVAAPLAGIVYGENFIPNYIEGVDLRVVLPQVVNAWLNYAYQVLP